jgi:hypothetical protein
VWAVSLLRRADVTEYFVTATHRNVLLCALIHVAHFILAHHCPHFDRENPARNRIAELVLSSIMVDCSNVGCTAKCRFSDAKVCDHIRVCVGAYVQACVHVRVLDILSV